MALRVLTGVLVPKGTNVSGGPFTATIDFNPHGVHGDASGIELNEGGSTGDFDFPPGKVVSIRQFAGGGPIIINDSVPTSEKMDVTWTVAAGTTLQEISYLIVGET